MRSLKGCTQSNNMQRKWEREKEKNHLLLLIFELRKGSAIVIDSSDQSQLSIYPMRIRLSHEQSSSQATFFWEETAAPSPSDSLQVSRSSSDGSLYQCHVGKEEYLLGVAQQV